MMDHEVISWGQPVLFLRNCSPGPNRTQGLRLRWVVAWRANLHGGLLSCSKVMLLTLDPSMFWTDDSWLSMPWLYFTFGSERTMFISATSAIFNPRSTGRVVAGLVVTVLLSSPMETDVVLAQSVGNSQLRRMALIYPAENLAKVVRLLANPDGREAQRLLHFLLCLICFHRRSEYPESI